MKMYIFENLNNVSNNYHPQGGLMVIAKDLDDLKEIVKEYNKDKKKEKDNRKGSENKEIIIIEDEDFKEMLAYELKDDNAERKIIIFPDAGCC
jgi:flagellar hook assembly protein FlgD